jgi:hypothetical protein
MADCISALPTSGVADAGGRVPRDGYDLVEHFLNPYGIVLIEMHDGAESFAVVKAIQNMGVSGETRESGLNPREAADSLRFGQAEIFHDADGFGIGIELGMPKTGAAIFVSVRNCEFVSERVFLQKAEGVADADVVVGLGEKSGAIKIGAEHDEEIRARTGVLSLRWGWSRG